MIGAKKLKGGAKNLPGGAKNIAPSDQNPVYAPEWTHSAPPDRKLCSCPPGNNLWLN